MAVRTKKTEELKVTRAHQFDSGDVGFSINYKGIDFYNMVLKLGEDKDGTYRFISWPSRKGSDGKYYKYYYIPFTEEEEKSLYDQIVELLK